MISAGEENAVELIELNKASKETVIPLTKSKLVVQDLPSGDPKQRKRNITKPQPILAFKPTIKLNEVLIKTTADIEPRL